MITLAYQTSCRIEGKEEMANQTLNAGVSASGSLYREFKFLSSHSVSVELQCGINRLELPASLLPSFSESDASELFVSAHILSHHRLVSLHEAPVRTHFATLDPYRCALVWDYVLSLPVRVMDLPRDATLVFTVWSEKGQLFGTSFTRLFDMSGRLKNGKRKRR